MAAATRYTRVMLEHDLFGKPVTIPDHVRGRLFFRIVL
jgi:hypothetical protein